MQRSRSLRELQEAAKSGPPHSVDYLQHVWDEQWGSWPIQCICKSRANKQLKFHDLESLKEHLAEQKHAAMIEKALDWGGSWCPKVTPQQQLENALKADTHKGYDPPEPPATGAELLQAFVDAFNTFRILGGIPNRENNDANAELALRFLFKAIFVRFEADGHKADAMGKLGDGMDLRDVVEDDRWQECLEKYLEFSIERRKAFDVLARMCSRRGYEKTPILELAEGACRDAAKQRRRQYEDRLERKKKQEEAAAKKKREDDRIAEEARRAREAEQARLAQEAANKPEEEEKRKSKEEERRKRKLQPNQIHREETKFSKLSEVEKEKYRLKAAQRRLPGAKERENAGAVGEEEEEE